MFGEILQKFVQDAPVTVMVRATLERLFNPEKLDAWFEATRGQQYTRTLLFSSLVGLMLQVVCRTQPSVNAAYRRSDIAVSIVSVYAKLKGVELTTSQALVHDLASDLKVVIDEMGGAHPSRLPGYRLKYLDGNCLAATEHRLGVLRETAAGALPGKSLVVFDPQVGMATHVFPCADGHTQERALLGSVVHTIEANDVWVADRNFCVHGFLAEIHDRQAYFIVRQHANLITKPLESINFRGRVTNGKVYEQAVQLTAKDGQPWTLRRIVVKLSHPTRDGDMTLTILTNLPAAVADAMTIAELYRTRWGIETAFQKLEQHLHSEIQTLGYPQAALFGFCLALVAFNLYAFVMAALRAAHPTEETDRTLSEYYVAAEIATTMNGLDIAVPEQDWAIFAQSSPEEFGRLMLIIAQCVNFKHYRKSPRGPKKPAPARTRFKGQPHVSTAKLLAAATADQK